MDLGLAGKIAVVGGASQGIGYAIARLLAGEGAQVAIVARRRAPLGAVLAFDDAAWDKAVQQNLMSVVRLTRGAVPHMRTRGGGRIVNITALSVLQPRERVGLSVATWAGVLGYAKTLSLEVAADQITVNTLCPGRIATGRLATVFGT